MNKHERAPKMEVTPSLEHEAVERLVQKALAEIDAKYGTGAPFEERLAYHNRQHTEKVIKRADRILKTIDSALKKSGKEGVPQRIALLTRLAAARHDSEEESEVTEADGKHRRAMKRGFNEAKSADDLVRDMNESGGVFSAEDATEAHRAILATEPEFKNGTVIQPKIEDEHSLVVLALALADIGGAGMDGPAEFIREGDALFFEGNPDVTNAILSGGKLDQETEKDYKERMLAWTESQVQFVEGRKEAFEHELEHFPEEVRGALRDLFSRFDETLQGIEDEIQERKKLSELSFEDLKNRMQPGLAVFQ